MDPALWELLTSGSADDSDQEVEAIIRLDQPGLRVAGVRIVARFGEIATCRLRKNSIIRVRRDRNVASLKAARPLGPETNNGAGVAGSRLLDSDRRRPPNVGLTGAGVVVGIVDWGCDFDHANFKRDDGSTRLLAMWDQRGSGATNAPRPYGYGVLHQAHQINDALRTVDPYATLGYHPADADRDGSGAHGTHVMDIAAGNGLGGGPVGIAPEADLVFVHLSDRGTAGLANLGDSVRILEAVDFIARTAARSRQPWVTNLSVGRHGGPHDGRTLIELALDLALEAAPGRFIVQSTGNYFDKSIHASGRVRPGQRRTLTVIVNEADVTPNELEVWYSGRDELAAMIESPTGEQSPWITQGERGEVLENNRIVGRIYHRYLDPNNLDNHIELFLYPWAPAGSWTVTLQAMGPERSVFHAWLERDEVCADCQAHFGADDADNLSTTGTIANGHTVSVGAYDAHSPTGEVAPFSSAGPTRDGRPKPELVAPGIRVLAARSAPRGSHRSLGMLTRKSGTSMAAPHVTGAVALCLQGAPHPLMSGEIQDLLRQSARRVSNEGASSRLGWGSLDIDELVASVAALPGNARAQIAYPTTNRKHLDANAKEASMNRDPEPGGQVSLLDPDRLYREVVSGQGGPLADWIDDTFITLARPGEFPDDQPEAGDVLVRIALGEPGLGHLAVLSNATTPWGGAEWSGVQSERGGPGLYATVIEGGAFPHTQSDRFARRVLDALGRMPMGQLLLRPRQRPGEDLKALEPSLGALLDDGEDGTEVVNANDLVDEPVERDGYSNALADLTHASVIPVAPGLEDFIPPEVQELLSEGVSMSLSKPTPASERCKAKWFAKLAKLAPDVRDALQTVGSSSVWREQTQRAIDCGFRDVNLLTDFAYFAVWADDRGYCAIPRGHPAAVDWLDLRKQVLVQLEAPSKPVEQGSPSVCVGRRENRLAAPEPEQAPSDLTGRYEYTFPGGSRSDGALAINQAGKHLELSMAPFARPFAPDARAATFHSGDLDQGNFLVVNKDDADRRFLIRVRGKELDLLAPEGGPPIATARRVEHRSTHFPLAVRSISRSIDSPATGSPGVVGQVVDVAREFLTTAFLGPFLYRQEHLPLSREQVSFLQERFTSAEFSELVRRAAATTGHRSADDSARESLRSELDRFVDRTVGDQRDGIHRSDFALARTIVRRTLSRVGFSNGNRSQSYLDWIQMIAELANRPIGADSVLGIRPSGSNIDTYVYDIDLEVSEAAFFLGGGVGEMSVRQVAPTTWPEVLKLRVWFGELASSVKFGTDHFGGKATSQLPWTPGDFEGRIERVKGGIGLGAPGVAVELGAGFLHIYGSELLPPLRVEQLSTDATFEPNKLREPRKWSVLRDVGLNGLIGHASANGRLEVSDMTQPEPEPIYAVQSGGQRSVYFCFNSALLTPAARQRVRIVSALWRPFLTTPASNLRIVGHADKAGDELYNIRLSELRAQNALTAFRDVLGPDFALPEDRATATGVGEAGAGAGGERAGAADRRVEVQLNGLTVLILDGE